MKIAVITEDGKTISQHFGRAPYYLVFTVKEGQITGTEMRSKLGHTQFAQEEHNHDHAANDPRGHGFDAQSQSKHARMVQAILDCTALIVRGMGRGAYVSLEEANITPYVTNLASAEEAVKAYVAGQLTNHTEKLH